MYLYPSREFFSEHFLSELATCFCYNVSRGLSSRVFFVISEVCLLQTVGLYTMSMVHSLPSILRARRDVLNQGAACQGHPKTTCPLRRFGAVTCPLRRKKNDSKRGKFRVSKFGRAGYFLRASCMIRVARSATCGSVSRTASSRAIGTNSGSFVVARAVRA